jgi:DNA polymerase-1
MLVQVHDELLVEVPEEEVEAVRDMVVARMEGAMTLNVPLKVETGLGRSWYEAK